MLVYKVNIAKKLKPTFKTTSDVANKPWLYVFAKVIQSANYHIYT